MNKHEYTQVRDIFTDALSLLIDAQGEFLEFLRGACGPTDDVGIARALDAGGYWLDGDEYLALRDARQLLERLVGRAHERSV